MKCKNLVLCTMRVPDSGFRPAYPIGSVTTELRAIECEIELVTLNNVNGVENSYYPLDDIHQNLVVLEKYWCPECGNLSAGKQA